MITLKDIIECPDLLHLSSKERNKCSNCGTVLQPAITGEQKSSKGIVCDDCYYDLISDELEKHPIGGYVKK